MEEVYSDIVIVGAGIVGSYTAYAALKKGLKVSIIEIGSYDSNKIICCEPGLVCSKRYHRSSFEARNHILGGNSTFWGGGLIRPPSNLHEHCCGTKDLKSDLVSKFIGDLDFDMLDKNLGLNTNSKRSIDKNFSNEKQKVINSKIHILNGKNRDIAKKWIDYYKKHKNCNIYSSSKIYNFNSLEDEKKNLYCESIVIRKEESLIKINSKNFLICSGIIDSIHIIKKFRKNISSKKELKNIGTHLHDHLSLEIADIKIKNNEKLTKLIKPKFFKNKSIRNHLEFNVNSGEIKGFFHFGFNFTEKSPYKEIKNWLKKRQQLTNKLGIIKFFLNNKEILIKILKIFIYKKLKNELLILDTLNATLTMDFESFPNNKNRLTFKDEEVILRWDINKEDQERFLKLLKYARSIIQRINSISELEIKPRFDIKSEKEALRYFNSHVIDAFHLGGGLVFNGKSLVNKDCLINGSKNIYVISTSILTRAGNVNPTYLLLAIADKFIRNITKK